MDYIRSLPCCANPLGHTHSLAFFFLTNKIELLLYCEQRLDKYDRNIKKFYTGDRAALLAQEALGSEILQSHIGRKFEENQVKATLIFRDFFFSGKLPS